MKHNGKTRNFALPIYDQYPDPDAGEFAIIQGNPDLQDGVYVYIHPHWRFIKSEIGDQYDFPVSINKFFGRRSTNLVINSQTWSPIAISIADFRDKIFQHTAGSSDVIINKRSRFTVECEFSARRSSGSNVPFGIRLLQRPAEGNACTLVNVWQSSTIYNDGERAQYGGILYEANWYTQNQRPDQNSGEYAVWTNLGSCASGSANFQPIDGSYGYNSCDINGVNSAFVRARAELAFYPGGAIRAEVATLGNGSVTISPDSFRLSISEG